MTAYLMHLFHAAPHARGLEYRRLLAEVTALWRRHRLFGHGHHALIMRFLHAKYHDAPARWYVRVLGWWQHHRYVSPASL